MHVNPQNVKVSRRKIRRVSRRATPDRLEIEGRSLMPEPGSLARILMKPLRFREGSSLGGRPRGKTFTVRRDEFRVPVSDTHSVSTIGIGKHTYIPTRALYIHARIVRANQPARQPASQPANDIRVEVFTERHLATTCLDALALAPSNFPIIERSPSIRTRSHMTRAHVRRYIGVHHDRVTHTGAGMGLCGVRAGNNRVIALLSFPWGCTKIQVCDKGLRVNVVSKIKYSSASAIFRFNANDESTYFRIVNATKLHG